VQYEVGLTYGLLYSRWGTNFKGFGRLYHFLYHFLGSRTTGVGLTVDLWSLGKLGQVTEIALHLVSSDSVKQTHDPLLEFAERDLL
jgi:hypothetical protein